MTISPLRRSFVHRRLASIGATFATVADASLAVRMPGDADGIGPLALADLSPLPRFGVKGPNALAWLGESGLPVPAANNAATVTGGGARVLRLADAEALILPDERLADGVVGRLAAAEAPAGCYPVPRRDTHAWFVLLGPAAADCMRKVCAVDLRPHRFPERAVAQTFVARMAAIVLRNARGPIPAYDIVADSASATYLWDSLSDAMHEFGGKPVGFEAVRDVERSTGT